MQTRRIRSKNTIALLSKLLQPLVDSGFLGAAEVGRIAQTCQELNQACLQDSIWASFCQREYPNTKFLPTSKKEKGYRLLYKSWSSPIVKRRPPAPTLGPPSCLATQIYICIHIKYNGTPISSLLYNVGKNLKPLFNENGRVRINLRNPIVLGKAEWDYNDQEHYCYEQGHDHQRRIGLPVKCKDIDPFDLSVQIHLYRTSDLGMCCLFNSKGNNVYTVQGRKLYVQPQDMDNITLKTKFDFIKEQRRGQMSFYQRHNEEIAGWPLQHSRQADLILEALPHPVFIQPTFEFNVLEGDDYCISKIHLTAKTKDSNDADATPRSFRNNEEHGVTLLHLFSELQAT